MITLKNLHLATEQEVFDQVARHLLTQMETSIVGSVCKYKHIKQDGTILKCAAGCLIADDEYTEDFDSGVSFWSSLIENGLITTDNCFSLIIELQGLHDEFETECWESELYNIADRFNLNTEVLNEIK